MLVSQLLRLLCALYIIVLAATQVQAGPTMPDNSNSHAGQAPVHKRNLAELVNKTEPAWPQMQKQIKAAKNEVQVLPASDSARGEALLATQVTTRSPLGAVIYETGGLLIDHGWLRILGSGSARLPKSVPQFNHDVGINLSTGAPMVFVAYDVLGGFFAIDGGTLGKPGHVFYMAPDSLNWEDMGRGYGDFVMFCLDGDLGKFYENVRWPGWQAEVARLKGDQAISIFPFLSAKGPPVAQRHRGVVPISELFALHVKAPK